MANEESFHSLGEDNTSDLSANRKRKSKAAVGNIEDGVRQRQIDLSNYWKKDHFCGTYFVRSIMSGKRESGLMKRLKSNWRQILMTSRPKQSASEENYHTKTNNKKSGQALSDNYKSNWIYWDSLQFLVPLMQVGKSKDNLPDCQSSSSRGSFHSFSEDASPEMEEDKAPVRSRKSSRTSLEVERRSLKSSKTELISTCILFLKNLQMPKMRLLNATFRSMYLRG